LSSTTHDHQAVAAAGGLLIAGSPAIAAEAQPAAPPQAPAGAGLKAVPSAAQASAPFHLCLTNTTNPRFCIQSNGTGQPVTITSTQANWSNFQTVYTFTNGGITWNQIENGNGNCLRAGTNNVVKIENGPCVHSDNADSWSGETLGPKDYQSYMWGDWMLVHGNMNGYKVLHAEPVSGDWTNWGALLA
jgi:hypothetical protein